jgi:two-component system, OmpR family, response regulator
VKGLEHGADDYVSKPFSLRELVLRIGIVLNRYESTIRDEPITTDELYQCEVGIADAVKRQFQPNGGGQITLTDAELDILILFLRNPGRVMSRDDLNVGLRGRLWDPTDRSLDGHIARLRRKIEPDPENPRFIKTVWRVGYVFTGDVDRIKRNGGSASR